MIKAMYKAFKTDDIKFGNKKIRGLSFLWWMVRGIQAAAFCGVGYITWVLCWMLTV